MATAGNATLIERQTEIQLRQFRQWCRLRIIAAKAFVALHAVDAEGLRRRCMAPVEARDIETGHRADLREILIEPARLERITDIKVRVLHWNLHTGYRL